MSDSKLGAWGADRQALERALLTGRGNDADAPDTVRFGRNVLQLAARRERSPDAAYDRPAAFVLVSRDGFEHLPAGTDRAPLLHTGQSDITGYVHFVNAGANGYSLAYAGDAAALFDAIDAAGYAGQPTLVYSPMKGASVLSWYPNGTADGANVDMWPVNVIEPTVEIITAVVDAVHRGELMTPDQTQPSQRVWEKAEQGHARRDAEARVQHIIRMALLGAFRHCSIRSEQPGKDGRTDLEIVEDQDRVPEQVVHHAVLELKVLREFGSTGDKHSDKQIAEHMEDGLTQAYSYGKHRSFRTSMLCCFDMRATNAGANAVLAPLAISAARLSVHLRHWFLYRSSDHLRHCAVAQALA
jgi:hypothetical protein